MIKVVTQYLREVQSELKQTTWPDKTKTKNMTALVLVVATLLAVYLGALDFLLQQLMTYLV